MEGYLILSAIILFIPLMRIARALEKLRYLSCDISNQGHTFEVRIVR